MLKVTLHSSINDNTNNNNNNNYTKKNILHRCMYAYVLHKIDYYTQTSCYMQDWHKQVHVR